MKAAHEETWTDMTPTFGTDRLSLQPLATDKIHDSWAEFDVVLAINRSHIKCVTERMWKKRGKKVIL